MIDKIYVMSRPDGWHKIGVSSDPSYRRKFLGSGVRVSYLVELGNRNAFIVEKYAHMAMAGAENSGEWFNAPRRECLAAIRAALDVYELCGPDQWKRVAEAKWRASGCRGVRGNLKGRAGVVLTAEQKREWGRIWRSKDYDTNGEALAAMGRPFNAVTANKLFGPSGRAPGARKRNET